MSSDNKFSEWLAQRLDRVGLNQRELAEKMGVKPQMVTQYKQGAEPRGQRLLDMAEALQVSADELTARMRGEGNVKNLNGRHRGVIYEHPRTIDARRGESYDQGASREERFTNEGLLRYVHVLPIFEPMKTSGMASDAVISDAREMQRAHGRDIGHVRRRYMVGDAMRRSIAPNAEVDCVPVDAFQGPGLYYMHIDGRPIIARLQPIGGGAWLIKYDNDEYEDELLLPDEKGFKSQRSGLPVNFHVYEAVRSYRVST